MHKQIEQIKKMREPKILKNVFNKKEIDQFFNLYEELLLQYIIKNKCYQKKMAI